MIVVRGVFQAKYGRGDELVALLKEGDELWPGKKGKRGHILTDLSGPFFTVVTEAQYESLSDWESDAQATFADPRFAAFFERMTQLVESGRRDFYRVAG